MLKALIIDDEENSQASLKGKLELFCPEIERILIATGTKLFQNNLSSEKPVIQNENGLKLMNRKK